jgi:Pyruvate/2-oxoacid:ferredoxin oxidoreductase delta subunit
VSAAHARLARMWGDDGVLARILEIMLSDEEARVLLGLPGTAAQAAGRSGVPPDRALAAIGKGHGTGLVYREPGSDAYALVHPRNLEEFVLSDARNAALGSEFLDLWNRRARREREEIRIERLLEHDLGRRVLPLPGHVHDQVIPFDDAVAIARGAGLRAAGQCSCRTAVRACDAPVDEICLAFDHAARVFVERGAMREITAAEAERVLARGADAGLVHMSSGTSHEGALTGVEFICNCCACCCNLLGPYFASGRRIHIGRNYRASLDVDLCDGCGECLARCLFGAVTLADGTAAFDGDLCVGCGQCAHVCPPEAIELVRREGGPDEPVRVHGHWIGPMEPVDRR